MTSNDELPRQGWRRAQAGVSMLFALCALAVLTLGAVALVRSVDTGMLVLGNLGFKKDAVAVGTVAAETATTWLQANSGGLNDDLPAQGYYSYAPNNLDITGSTISTTVGAIALPQWDSGSCTAPGTAAHSSVVCLSTVQKDLDSTTSVSYLITRLCEHAGPTGSTNNCVVPLTSQAVESTQGGQLKGPRFPGSTDGVSYRILTRTVSVRGTVAYTETLVHY